MEIDLVNKLYAYTGQHKNVGMDDKNRLGIPMDIMDIMQLRKKAFGLDDVLLYYTPNTPDSSILLLKDILSGDEIYSELYHSTIDKQRRINIKGNIADNLSIKRDFIFVGYGDHIRVYSQKDLEKLQTTE